MPLRQPAIFPSWAPAGKGAGMLARRRGAWEKPGGVEPVQTLAELVDRARAAGPRVVAVPAAESETALAAVVEARRRGVARGLLLGDAERLADRLWKLEEDPSHHEILHEPDDLRAAARAVEAVRAGAATLLLKGRLPTGDLLRAVLDRSRGLRTGRILSDVMVSEHPSAAPPRVVGITDGGVNVAPDLAGKRAILENAVRVFHRLGFERPVVAVLCAVETVSDAMPHTRDARELAEMARRGEIRGCEVVGPLALDNAILPWAARAKGIEHPLAGRADLLLVPTIEAGNILGKAFSWLAGRPVAHVIEGARVPVLIPSRVERADDKLLSIALGVLSAEEAPVKEAT